MINHRLPAPAPAPAQPFNPIFGKHAAMRIGDRLMHVEFSTDGNVTRKFRCGKTITGAFEYSPAEIFYGITPENLQRAFALYVFHMAEGEAVRFIASDGTDGRTVTVEVNGKVIFQGKY